MISRTMNAVLERWNGLGDVEAAVEEVLPCCGSRAWARGMTRSRPFADEAEVLAASDAVWWALEEGDWREAFRSHPRIGEREAPPSATAVSAAWSGDEQGAAMEPASAVKEVLREANARYEERFGRVFLICAAGRSAGEILEALERRMGNDAVTELRQAAEQQRQITALRLRRWMEGS